MNDDERTSHINMSDGFITCVVRTPVPLPPDGYTVLAKLAEAVAMSVAKLDEIIAQELV